MGHIAALLSKTDEDVSKTLLRMLEASSLIKGDAYGLASSNGVAITYSSRSLRGGGNPMLGYKLTKIQPDDLPQPLDQHGYAMVFEGRIWDRPSPSNVSTATDLMGASPSQGIQRLIKQVDGSYAVASISGNSILCGRDPVGVFPLYFGESPKIAGVASNRKMLWVAGLETTPIPPGHFAKITTGGVSTTPVRTIRQPSVTKMKMAEAVEELDRTLSKAATARCRGLSRVALGFSGGIDSSLLAHYLDEAGVEVNLICVGMENSTDFGAAEQSAEDLGLSIRLKSFTVEDVDEDLDNVLWSVEEPDPMKVGVALPLHWTVRSSAESGNRVFFSGSGSDELFGGYYRHIREYVESGRSVMGTMFKDVVASHEVNYSRDLKICSDAGMELRLPFADIGVVELGLSIPPELKLPPDPGDPRKLVLRALAERLGFPMEIASRRKRAVQYSTGVHKALVRLAKKGGKTLHGYLAKRFNRVKEDRLRGLQES